MTFQFIVGIPGTYPYLFNTMANKGVLLSHLPDKEYYRPEFMGTKEREEFEKWYEENYHNAFDNDFELISYCCSDVTILREACVKFKNLVKKVTTIPGADPAVAPPIEVFASTTKNIAWNLNA